MRNTNRSKSALPPPGVSQLGVNYDFIPVDRTTTPRDRALAQARAVVEQSKKVADKKQARKRGPRKQQQKSPQAIRHGDMTPEESSHLRKIRSSPTRRERVEIPNSVPLPSSRRKSPLVEFDSVDGYHYTFRKSSIENKTPEMFKEDLLYMVLVSLAELAKGGNPIQVLRAFKLKLPDENGDLFFDYQDEYELMESTPLSSQSAFASMWEEGPLAEEDIYEASEYGAFSEMLEDE